MSEPADLIAAGASGLHPSDDLAGARRAAERAGWRIVDLDTSSGQDKAHFLQVCRQAFQLPDWFGGNWDALADSLSDVRDRPGTLVLWRGAGGLDASVREIAAEIFAERAARSHDEAGAFLVLVGGRENTRRTMNDL
ncbi:barstar family protein [Flexivirga lutea]